MGRVSMPIMNKTGYSMYWNCMWDDKLNYSRSLKEDIFIKNFIYIFFEGGSNSMFFIDLKFFFKMSKYLVKNYNFQIKKYIQKNELGLNTKYKYYVEKKKNFRPYLSKIWILKYQSWIIIYFYSYSFNLSVFYKKKSKKSKNLKKYFNIILHFYKNTIKTFSNYYFLKKNLVYFF